MNIQDHKNFTQSLLKLNILNDYIKNSFHEIKPIILLDNNNQCWDTIVAHTIVEFENHILRDIKIDLQKIQYVENHSIADCLEILFDIDENIDKHSLHIIAIEDLNNKLVQYITVLDDTSYVPTIEFITNNTLGMEENFEYINSCYRDLMYALNINIPILNEEIYLTVLDDVRTKVSQIVMYGECDNIISVTYDELGFTNEIIDNMRDKFLMDMQNHEEFKKLTPIEQEELFQKSINHEIQLFIHAAGNTDIFEDLLEEQK